jgi:putative membrane protein
MDSELANDRTYLAWLRTGIALFGLGFVVAKFALIVQPDATPLKNKSIYGAVGVIIVLSGAALVVVGYLQHAHVWRYLRGEAAKPRWPLAMTVTAFVGSLVLSVLIVVST